MEVNNFPHFVKKKTFETLISTFIFKQGVLKKINHRSSSEINAAICFSSFPSIPLLVPLSRFTAHVTLPTLTTVHWASYLALDVGAPTFNHSVCSVPSYNRFHIHML